MTALKTSNTPFVPVVRRDWAAMVGWTLSAVFAAFMLGASAFPKLAAMPIATLTMAELGWPYAPTFWIGVMEAGFTILYLWPRTALLGAIMMMGVLGGAMATQIRADSPLFSHVLFSVYLGAAMWGGLWLRDPSLRAILPLRRGRGIRMVEHYFRDWRWVVGGNHLWYLGYGYDGWCQ